MSGPPIDAPGDPPPTSGPILFFDGVCNVCSAAVQFVVAHEAAPVVRFAPLQSEVARTLLAPHGLDPRDLDTVILLHEGKAYTRSSAALRTARFLRAPWSWARALVLVPAFVRDAAYNAFAASRYRLFGKKDACMIPTKELRARFLGE